MIDNVMRTNVNAQQREINPHKRRMFYKKGNNRFFASRNITILSPILSHLSENSHTASLEDFKFPSTCS